MEILVKNTFSSESVPLATKLRIRHSSCVDKKLVMKLGFSSQKGVAQMWCEILATQIVLVTKIFCSENNLLSP